MSRWCPSDADLKDLTVRKARDLIANCFFEAQKETLSRAREKLGAVPDDEKLRQDVKNIMAVTFREMGFSYDEPTKEQLGAVVMKLAQKAGAWGTPQDIIEHHQGLIGNIFSKLP